MLCYVMYTLINTHKTRTVSQIPKFPPRARKATRPQRVTLRHRLRDHLICHMPFPIGGPLIGTKPLSPTMFETFGPRVGVFCGIWNFDHVYFAKILMWNVPQIIIIIII